MPPSTDPRAQPSQPHPTPTVVVVLLALVAITALGCSREPTRIVKDYLSQENCLDRAKFILDPEANRPLLAEYYKGQKECVKPFQSLKAEGCDKLADGGLLLRQGRLREER